MELIVFKQAMRELKDAPADIIEDVFSLFDELMAGRSLSMPISRPLPTIARGLHELRLSGKAGEYRVFYKIESQKAVYVLHATEKKGQKTEKRTIILLKKRIKELDK